LRDCRPEELQVADECARRALDICLSKTILNNFDRARLLDIVLWSGDIVSCSRTHHPARSSDAEKTRHENRQFRRLGIGGPPPN